MSTSAGPTPLPGDTVSSPHPINLKNHTVADLMARLVPLGIPEGQVRQVMARVVGRNLTELAGLPGLSRARQALLGAHTVAPRLEPVERIDSPVDRFTRFLFRTHDGHLLETVRIPLHRADRYSVCISSQVGCALGCTFCATGRLGFVRNLEPWEMVDQVLQAMEEVGGRAHGAVFMGQGEPFLNYDNVITAATILRESTGCAIRAENITISTAGILPNIRRYTEEGHPFRLIVSLSAGTSETRRQIMPIDRKYPLLELAAAIRDHARARKTRATIAWVAIEGVNTGMEEIEALKQALEGVPYIFNLITVNDPTGRYVPPDAEGLRRLLDDLQVLGMPVVRRYTGGRDVDAACGMLASTVQGEEEAARALRTRAARAPAGRRARMGGTDAKLEPEAATTPSSVEAQAATAPSSLEAQAATAPTSAPAVELAPANGSSGR